MITQQKKRLVSIPNVWYSLYILRVQESSHSCVAYPFTNHSSLNWPATGLAAAREPLLLRTKIMRSLLEDYIRRHLTKYGWRDTYVAVYEAMDYDLCFLSHVINWCFVCSVLFYFVWNCVFITLYRVRIYNMWLSVRCSCYLYE